MCFTSAPLRPPKYAQGLLKTKRLQSKATALERPAHWHTTSTGRAQWMDYLAKGDPPDFLVSNPARKQPSIIYEILENVDFIVESRKKPRKEGYQVRGGEREE